MSSESQDSDGEDLSTIRPNLIRELQNVLDLYPDDGQILKELIQNAEDAGASVVKVLSDRRYFNQNVDAKTSRKHPHLNFFQGPAMCVYNDSLFSDEDWKGIRMLHASIKEKNALKVGRFGLGFKSVFHLTDRLVILSGDYIMYMDPFKGEDLYCKRHLVKGRKKRELESILRSLDGVFGVCSDTFHIRNGHFPGTLFWFPLRQKAGDLSSTVYTEENMDNLLGSFKAEASSLLLFLNHIESVHILVRDDVCRHIPEEIFSVGIASSCLEKLRHQRECFVEEITTTHCAVPQNEAYYVAAVVMETIDHVKSSKDSQHWLVSNYHSGQRQISKTLFQLCSNPELSYRPYVGLAFPLTNKESFQSQIFCFLPLPLDTRSPTGLPVHVHGYFALEQNRRHLKWPTADQLSNYAKLDPPSLWNCQLVKELLPRVYNIAILELKRLNSFDLDTFYCAWPEASIVSDRWRSLVEPVYADLIREAVFFSHNKNQWVVIEQAVLEYFNKQFSKDVKESVIKVYAVSQQTLVKMPDHVYNTLNTFRLLERVEKISAVRVSKLIPTCLSDLSRSEKLFLMHYLCSFDEKLLLNQKLLPLADGISFGTFTGRHNSVSTVLLCSEQLHQLLPGLETKLCDNNVPTDIKQNLQSLAESGIFSVDCMHKCDPRIPSLLQESLQARFRLGKPVLRMDDIWLKRVWQYLSTLEDIRNFKHVSLLPVKLKATHPQSLQNKDSLMLHPLTGIYICGRVNGLAPLYPALASALTKLGILILDKLPDYARLVLGPFVNYPDGHGIIEAVSRVDRDPTLRSCAIKDFNSHVSKEDKTALIEFLSDERKKHSKLPAIFKDLMLFTNALTQQPTSVGQISRICPPQVPPIPLPTSFLACDTTERKAALCLGATETSLVELVENIMLKMRTSSGTAQYSRDHVVKFMIYFLENKDLMGNSSLLPIAKDIQFVKTKSNKLKLAQDLYDPLSPLLKELFLAQSNSIFAHGEFAEPEMLKKLKKIGLRTETEVSSEDLLKAAKEVPAMFRNQHKMAWTVGNALFKYLSKHGNKTCNATLNSIAGIQCLPCLQDAERPKDYPTSLPLATSPALVKPSEMNCHELLYITGSARPVLKRVIERSVAEHLQLITVARPEDVLQHLKNIIQSYTQEEAFHYKPILHKIFQFFAHCCSHEVIHLIKGLKCILIESGQAFASPENFWIQQKGDDIDLKPYRFPLPVEMKQLSSLMKQCGSSQFQNDRMLLSVLSEIQYKHKNVMLSHSDFQHDFSLVKQILDVLQRSDSSRQGNTLLPILHHDADKLHFMAASECTISPGSPKNLLLLVDVGFEIYYVHPDIAESTALALGAKLMRDRALTGMEDLDYGYSQHEDLTTRLHNLLKEAYTDGFSVPKELIQNADDAHASRVYFLLDERENMACRSNLIADGMASLQGPAIWAYNDAVFAETDFENIVKLGSGTKKQDTTKIGKFGLGFNAVYNLTDVPAFISGHKLAMFDPQLKYLERGKGLMLDFTKPVNKALLGRMPQQFEPFQNVFGCTLSSEKETCYRGTLFRFPLRTKEQAVNNKLKTDDYSELKRREFLKMLVEKAGNLLMFTQSVQEVEVYYLPGHCSDPRDSQCLLTVRKNSISTVVHPTQLKLGNRTILKFMADYWSNGNRDIRIQQNLTIKMDVMPEAKAVCDLAEGSSVTHWRLAWASGIDETVSMAEEQDQEDLVPVAAAAISLSENHLIPLENHPTGFYNTGHLFCFLPLPEEMVRVPLSVHINGTFAVTSDRRGLLVRTEDDLALEGFSWNQALFSDPVVRAYLLLLELVRNEATSDADFNRYFDLWPTSLVTCLVESFYQCLQYDKSKVFPVPDQNKWVCFEDARFLCPDLRKTDCGKIAWDCLQKFWKGPGYLVDVPETICRLIKNKGSHVSFDAKVISELAFYKDFFLPSMQDSWWNTDHRDMLVHYALLKNDQQLNQLLKQTPCIPTQCIKQLKKPGDLVDPFGQVAKLFLPSEGCFPQNGISEMKAMRMGEQSNTITFCDISSLRHLVCLGMTKDELSWERVLERAKTVEQLNKNKKTEEAVKRASHLIEYLSLRNSRSEFMFDDCPDQVRSALMNTAFLPVLPKPQDWPYEWAGKFTDNNCFAPPVQLFSDSLKNFAACKVKMLDVVALTRSETMVLPWPMRNVLKVLGLLVEKDYNNQQLLDFAVQQLIIIANHHNADSDNNRTIAQNVSNDIYAYLNTCLKQTEDDHIKHTIVSELSDKNIVWTGAEFVKPSRVAFNCQHDCSPYLFQLQKGFQRFKHFFECVGVNVRFQADAIRSVLKKLHEENIGAKLSDDDLRLISHLAQLLGDSAKTLQNSGDSFDTTCIFLPDIHGMMQLSSHLCIDDCEWLRESDQMKFVHRLIAPEIAQLLGVKTKRRQDFDMLAEPFCVEPFGQSEKLTTRIKRLLQGYTFDASLCKELIQNADDAGATEAKFIMDFRSLGTDTVLENWEYLQGPALCFYNNKSFTKTDMLGIQNLGLGSKGGDALKIGQFGVGFNSVFHITDVPSFWTKEDDEKDVICVLDPNCQYVHNTEPSKPGVKFSDVERLMKAYPDFLSGYLIDGIDRSQSGTLFRFPLRTVHMAKCSEIKKQHVTEGEIKILLDAFKKEMSTCLLFLNNLHRIGMYSVCKDGSLKKEFDVRRTIKGLSQHPLDDFKAQLKLASTKIMAKDVSVTDIDAFETVIESALEDSEGRLEHWLIVHRLGLGKSKDMSSDRLKTWDKQHFRVLPSGGVAVKLKRPENASTQKISQHHVFCSLPLPVETELPVHVNGHFALDHETRRNLWGSGDHKCDERSQWNDTIALHVIVPAYITALKYIKESLFPQDGVKLGKKCMKVNLNHYNSLFPQFNKAKSDIWKKFIQELYQTLAREKLVLFPVLCSAEQPILEWVPVVDKGGFPGHFSNIVEFVRQHMQVQEPQRKVVLSQGISATANQNPNESSRKCAKTLELLLKRLNMKVLEMPFHVYNDFKASGVDGVQQVTTSSVLEFLKSSGRDGACSIQGLPAHIKNTPLKTAENVKMLLEFVCNDKHFLNNLNGLPLCLRQSGNLYKFSCADQAQKPIISRYSSLLPGSAEDFVHDKILKYFEKADQTKGVQVLLQLNINMVADRLKHSLTNPILREGKPCIFDCKMFPPIPYGRSWFELLWDFLKTQFKDDSAAEMLKDRAAEMLKCLEAWCLILVKKRDGNEERSMLYPIHALHKVVYLPEQCDQTNGNLWSILKNLPLPFLHGDLHDSIARKLVASVSHPLALLHALASCADCLSASHVDGMIILNYFNNNISVLKESCEHETEVKKRLRSLPVYPAIGNKLVTVAQSSQVLCVGSSVPEEGLSEWSLKRKVTILRENYVPRELIVYLDFISLSDANFYCQYLLPSIDCLPPAAILTHMEFLRDNFFKNDYSFENMNEEQKQLSNQLKVTAFILVDGIKRRAGDFYTLFDPVFKVMCSPESFPIEPFCRKKWKGLMNAAGIISCVTDDMFLDYARAVASEGSISITDQVTEKSQTLVRHLFQREQIEQNGWLLSQVKSIKFLLPAKWMNTVKGREMQKIVPPFCPVRLVSYDESCFVEHLDLVWSSSCIIDKACHPMTLLYSNKKSKKILSLLCVEEKAPKSKVLKHIKNICNQLGGDKGRNAFVSLDKDMLTTLMDKQYEYLCDNIKDEDIPALKQLTLICDIDHCQMLCPSNVVFDLRPNEMIKGHIEKAPSCFGRYFELFKKLGATERVTANHYAVVLSSLKNQSGNEELNVEELKIVKTAVEGLFGCLRGESEGEKGEKKIKIDTFYLPTEKKNLQKSTEIILKDYHVGERFTDPPEGWHFFIGFQQLGIKVFSEVEEMKLLPQKSKVVLLSEVVTEVISDDGYGEDEADFSNPLVANLQNALTKQALVRLVYHNCKCLNKVFSEESARHVVQKLMSISVKTVHNLKTSLTVFDRHVPGTEQHKPSFTKKLSTGEGHRSAVIYISEDSVRSWPEHEDVCFENLAIAVSFMLQISRSYYLHQILKNPKKAKSVLDRNGITHWSGSSILEGYVFPPAGNFVPLKFHDHLINGFFDFHRGEHVGYELYDPETEDEYQGTEAEDFKEDPVFIYGIILREHSDSSVENAGRLNRYYLVDLGALRGHTVLKAIKLYKFVRKTSESAMAQYQGDLKEEPKQPLVFEDVLREIRNLLTEAWQMPERKDRKQVIKRLLLQWHPDKNPDNPEFCTRVTQALMHYIEMLDKGKKLPVDDDSYEYDASADTDAFYRSGLSFHPSFFTNMHARGKKHKQYSAQSQSRFQKGSSRRFGGGYGNNDTELNPQPGESRRLFVQAEADLTAADAAKGTCHRGHNWICFQCHQAVEKALKAVLCYRDADSFDSTSHNIQNLARRVKTQNRTLQDLDKVVEVLEERIGPHARMCYPDVLVYPRVPADVYTANDADFAHNTATLILRQLKPLTQG